MKFIYCKFRLFSLAYKASDRIQAEKVCKGCVDSYMELLKAKEKIIILGKTIQRQQGIISKERFEYSALRKKTEKFSEQQNGFHSIQVR